MKQNGGLKIDDYGKLLKQWQILVNSAKTNANIKKVREMKIELDNLLRYNQHQKDQHHLFINLSSGTIPSNSNYYSTNKEGIPEKKYSFNYNRTFNNYNRNKKSAHRDMILKQLSNRYKHNKNFNFAELNRLASIGASILSIKEMPNGEPKKILLNALRETIKQSKNSLNKYPEFQEYENYILSISAQ
jgi:hypothetical protein